MYSLSKDSEIPGLHFVPTAIDNTTPQTPLAQRWNPVPSMQFHNPSGVHCVPGSKESETAVVGIDELGAPAVLVDLHVEKAGVESPEDPPGSSVGNSLGPVESSAEGELESFGRSTEGPAESTVGVSVVELSKWVGEGRGSFSVALIDLRAQEPSGGAVSEP